jgi:predicted RNase H-like nuclease
MWYVGVDLSKKRWLAIGLKKGSPPKVNLFSTIAELWAEYGKKASLILIDIPIGLTEKGAEERVCDKKARELLNKGKARRGSTVFPVPCRQAVYAVNYSAKGNYEFTSRVNNRITGRKLSQQIYWIAGKIKEVDEFLVKNKPARSRLIETHPELCFWAINNCTPMESKRKSCGKEERERVLFKVCSKTTVNAVREKSRGMKVNTDDSLDALVAAVTASHGKAGLKFVPEKIERDSHGLPMQIAYPSLKIKKFA